MWLSTPSAISVLFNPSCKRFFSTAQKSGKFFPTMPQGYKIKRFYKKVDIIEHPLSAEHPQILPQNAPIDFKNLSLSQKYYAVTLDGKVTKTMYKDDLLIPTRAMAVALAEEWESQNEFINLKSLHLVSFINSSLII